MIRCQPLTHTSESIFSRIALKDFWGYIKTICIHKTDTGIKFVTYIFFFQFSCLQSLLPQDKVCILVTHQLQYLTEVNDIVLLDGGSVAVHGNLNQLKNSEYKSFLWMAAANDDAEEHVETTNEIVVN